MFVLPPRETDPSEKDGGPGVLSLNQVFPWAGLLWEEQEQS